MTRLLLALMIFTACGDDGGGAAPPRVLAGGGIGDGPIDGVANVYVIDDATRAGIAGATVTVGEAAPVTSDADGLAIVHGVSGPQTVTVAASGYRTEMWVGANGANLTFDLQPPVPVASGMATVQLTVSHIADVPVAAGHARIAVATYLQTDDIGDADNSIVTADDTKRCISTMAAPACAMSLNVRPGTIGILALIYDIEIATPSNITLERFAVKNGIQITAGQNPSAPIDLDLVAADDVATETVDYGTPPASLAMHEAIVGVETADGVYQIGIVANDATGTLLPQLAAVGGTGYRLSAIAANSATPPTNSVVLRRAQTTATLSAGAWLDAPTNVNITRSHAAFTPPAGATISSIELKEGTADDSPSLLDITVFDPALTAIDIPASVALPSEALDVKVSAIGAPGLDVTDFSLDADKDKLVQVAAVPGQVAD